MQIVLSFLNRSSQERIESRIEVEERVVIGRHVDSPVVLQGESLSRQHFALFSADGQLMVESMGSNGTRVNGSALAVQEPVALYAGDLVEVPGYEINIEEILEGSSEVNAGADLRHRPHALALFRQAIVDFFDPLEATLLLCALSCIGLCAYYFST